MIAIVVPCYNEESRLDINNWKLIMQTVPNCVWIYVNDGSTDRTYQTLSFLESKKSHILNLSKNFGKGEAIRAGLNFALKLDSSAEIRQVGYLDSDGAFALKDITQMIEVSSTQFDIDSTLNSFIGSRVKLAGREIHRSPSRHYLGRIIGTFVGLSWNDAPYDTQSGFKIFKVDKNFSDSISERFQTRWFFDIELLLRLQSRSGTHPWEFPLSQWHEVGSSKINVGQAWIITQEIFRIRRIIKKFKLVDKVSNGFN